MTEKWDRYDSKEVKQTLPYDLKVNSSIKTHNTSQEPMSNKLSLLTCSSSISIEKTNEGYQEQLKLFGQYLLTSSQRKKEKLLQSMRTYYNLLLTNKLKPITFLLYSHNSHQSIQIKYSHKQLYLYHFIGAWLLSMGYKHKQTKKYVLSKLYNHFKNDPRSISFYENCYKSLNFDGFREDQRIKFLINLCKNGWEYFIFQIINLCKPEKTIQKKQNLVR